LPDNAKMEDGIKSEAVVLVFEDDKRLIIYLVEK
jgi:hypothetical protein